MSRRLFVLASDRWMVGPDPRDRDLVLKPLLVAAWQRKPAGMAVVHLDQDFSSFLCCG